jgi:protein O-GlcNAc transferase
MRPIGNPAAGDSSVPAPVAELFAAALQHHQAGRLPVAESFYRQILAIDPDNVRALHLLGVLSYQLGRHDKAVALIAAAIARNANEPFFHCNLGLALQAQGQLEEAVASYGRALSLAPDLADAHFNLGNALQEQARLAEAVAAYRRALAVKPDHAAAHSNLGVAFLAQGKLDEALASLDRALSLKPDYADAYANRGNALQRQGRVEEAVAAYLQALSLRPDYAEAHYNLGNAMQALGKRDEAVVAYGRALSLRPDYAEAHYNLGLVLQEQGRLDEAAASYGSALAVDPDYAEAHGNLGTVLHEQGKPDEALACYERALAAKPDYVTALSALLLCLIYRSDVSAEKILAAHRRFEAQHARALYPASLSHDNDRAPQRRLRIGYVSPDFRAHSVTWFLEPVLRAHDRNSVELFCYAEVKRPDGVTEILRPLADHWRVTVGLSDAALAAQIRADGIDILVDLAGHTANNRLLVFARKPAPVQVSWLGYPATTGLAAIDYRLVDAVTDPPGTEEAQASETLVRLEHGFLCYGPALTLPEPAAPPCLAGDAVTFGSFNNPAKLSEATLDCWASLLRRVPGSRLLLKGRAFGDDATRALYLGRLAERGVAAERIELVSWLPNAAAHLALYDRVDIALDPFPYNGTTTTCEALWMGVPVVGLRGDRHAGRVGASLLGQVGLDSLVAETAEDYIAIAAGLAAAPQHLASLRASLRPRMLSASLCDARGFTAGLEAAYRTMWRRWCEGPAEE